MCEGPQEASGPSTTNTDTSHNRLAVEREDEDGDENAAFPPIDHPPPVMDREGQCRNLVSQTPQHLITLSARNPNTQTWSGNPLLWNERYLVLPTLSGQVVFFDLTVSLKMTDEEETAPLPDEASSAQVATGENNTLPRRLGARDTCVSDFNLEIANMPDLVVQAVLPEDTPDGVQDSAVDDAGNSIVQICLAPRSFLGSERDTLVCMSVSGRISIIEMEATKDSVHASVVFSFATGRCGCQAITVTRDNLLIIGYDVGHLEAWKIQARPNPAAKGGRDPTAHKNKRPLFRKRLHWRGSFAEAPQIKSILHLAHFEADASLLIVTLQDETRSLAPSMIEVVDLKTLQLCWEKALDEDDTVIAVNLDESCVMARPGKEISIPSMNPPDFAANIETRHRLWTPSKGTDGLAGIHGSAYDGTQLSRKVCAAALADGSVLMINLWSEDGRIEWGLEPIDDQYMMPFASIGIGEVLDESTKSHIACCLRGGTVYLIPCDSNGSADPVKVIFYPHDIDSDTPPRRVEFFTSGNISYTGDNQKYTTKKIPILVYCWPGGIVDIYSSSLLQDKRTCTNALLVYLSSNGSVQNMRDFLTNSSSELLCKKSFVWQAAKDEVAELSCNSPMTMAMLNSSQYKCFRSLMVILES